MSDNLPAFPSDYFGESGMTLRDYFAAKALNAYLSDIEWRYDTTVVEAAEAAYQMADAMLKARES